MNWLRINKLPIKTAATIVFTSALAVILAQYGMMIFAVCVILSGAAASILVSGSFCGRLKKVSDLVEKAATGQAIPETDFNTDDDIDRVGTAVKKLMEDQRKLAQAASKLAQGDIGADIQPRSDQDILAKALQLCQKNLRTLNAELTQAAEAAKDGRLTERCQSDELKGIYADLLENANHVMDALVLPVGRALKILNAVTHGDLSARVKGEYRGDHAIFQNALNLTIKTLDDALLQVGQAAEQVAAAAGHISSGSQTLSNGSSEQAGSIQEVSSSLQQVASMTKQNAQNAKEASNLSRVAQSSVEAGVASMNRLSDAISRIKASSDSTAKIIKTIDEIAFQTNLLALNAAVEAARAGDAGKGFAVVAEEVRNLAMRSAEAAKNTTNLIEESVRNSENGVALNQEVLKNLNEINDQVRKVGGVMAEIAEASEQQTMGVDQVNVVIQRMGNITQQIATNAEESASGAEELSGQSEELKSMVYAFRLSNRNVSGEQLFTGSTQKKSVASTPRKQTAELKGIAAKPGVNASKSIAAQAEQLIPFGDPNLSDFRDF